MEGSKQCPQCECTDVPVNAEQCPFCGYEFVKKTVSESAKKQNVAVVKEPEEKKQPEGTGNQSIVTEGPVMPESTDYKTYQKKGRKKKADSSVSREGQGSKTIICSLAVALAMAALCMWSPWMYNVRFLQYPKRGVIFWEYVLAGVIAASMHYCCFGGDKGSRKAGAVGIVAGYIGYFYLSFHRQSESLDILFKIKLVFSQHGWMLLIAIATYIVCWFMATKLAKDNKRALWFCLTAVEVVVLPYLLVGVRFSVNNCLNQLSYNINVGIGDILRFFYSYWRIIYWKRIPGLCVAMLLTEFLLYRVRAWLAVKPRRLFWKLYLVIVIMVLIYMFFAMDVGWLRIGVR